MKVSAEFLNYRIQFKLEQNFNVTWLEPVFKYWTSSLGSCPMVCLIRSLQLKILQDF